MSEQRTNRTRVERWLATSAVALAAALAAKPLTAAFESEANADMVAKSGSLAMMTTATETDEALYVIDDQTERLLAYVFRQERFELIASLSLPEMFAAGRARAAGGR